MVLVCTGCSFAADGTVLTLMYHDFSSTEEGAAANPSWCTSADKFRRDLAVLYERGYRSLSAEDYVAGTYDAGGRYFILTFDDGYRSCFEVAYPILQETGTNAVLFLNTDRVSEDPKRLTWEQVAEMETSGLVTAYSHLPVHVEATSMTRDELTEAFTRSYTLLEEMLDRDVDRRALFAYPYGAYSEETVAMLRGLGVHYQLVQGLLPELTDSSGLLVRFNVGYATDVGSYCTE